MTARGLAKEKRMSKSPFKYYLLVFLILLMLYFSPSLKRGAALGLRLSLDTIIPTLFPFFILSDMLISYGKINGGRISKAYGWLFGVGAPSLSAYLLGSLCGFPLGVRSAVALYRNGAISKDELERIAGFSNNPSAAFVISGIGAGLYTDIRVGIKLYSAVLLSSVLVGIIFRSKQAKSKKMDIISKQSFDFVKSIPSAGISSLTVSCYIVFFSSVVGLLSEVIKNPLALAVAAGFLEITNASSLAAALSPSYASVKYVITAFALGFSGLSVHMQAFALLPPEISKSKYLFMKLAQGFICSAIIFFLMLV